MKYLLIAFVIFLALAPLSHFIPSKRQRLIARLREYAAVHGLFVEFRSPPKKARRSPDGGALIYYGKRLPNSCAGVVSSSAWIRDDWGWRGLDRPGTAPDELSGLPAGITLATVDEASCGVYWDEDGGEETLVEICTVLDEWSGRLGSNKRDFP